MKKFETRDSICDFEVEILKDPFEFLLNARRNIDLIVQTDIDIIDCIVLPLYSPRSEKVEERSGLNQWNAKGRPRDANEVYVPVPKWIHQKKKDFFQYTTSDNKTDAFGVRLPNGEILSMKIAQEGGKALMSNPNKALGKWILRDILNIKEGKLVTKEMLDIIGIDSVKLSKNKDGIYSLDFLKTGSFDIFKEEFNN